MYRLFHRNCPSGGPPVRVVYTKSEPVFCPFYVVKLAPYEIHQPVVTINLMHMVGVLHWI